MFASIKQFWKRMGKMKVPYLFGYLFSALVIINSILTPKISGALVDMFLTESSEYNPVENSGYFIFILVLLVVMVALKDVCQYFKILLLEKGSQKVLVNVRCELYEKLHRLDQGFYTKNTTGDLLSRLTGDLDLIRHIFSWVFYNAFEAVALFIGSFIILVSINPWLTLIMLAVAPLIFVFNWLLSKTIRPEHQKNREQSTILSTLAKENITGNRVVKAFVREEYEKKRMTVENKKMTERNVTTHMKWLRFHLPISFLCEFLGIIGLFGGAIFCIIDPENFTVGDLTVFTSLTWALNYPMLISGTIINDLQRYSASAEKVSALIYIDSAIKEKENAIELTDKIEKIEFKNVSLSIDGMKILNNINLTINKGETVGIMGPTGSGKSMLVAMLARFYDPTEGEIYINGVDVREYTISSLRRKFGYSHQDVFLFSNSIEGNIAYSDPDMPSERVYECAKIADAHNFITRSTIDGYDTIIGERGIGLSGGQKQRIALARALATNAEVIILDDTTSAVDMETEKKIQESLSEIDGVAKIIIAQRITSVYKSDKIIILENGEITEQGKHGELKNNGGYYSRVFNVQHGSDKAEVSN